MAIAAKKRYTIDELRAFKLAYGRPIQREDYLINILLPALLAGGMTHLLLHYLWLTIIMTLVGALYGYLVLFPANIKRFYERRSFEQKNNFVNTVTQILMAPNVSIFAALQDVIDLTEGDFKEQLTQLVSQLLDSPEQEYHLFFEEFKLPYEKDVIFCQYIDILETIAIEGSDNSESLKKSTSFHNDIKEFQQKLEVSKAKTLSYMKTGQLIITAAIFFCHFKIEPLTFDNYVKYFSHSPIGWITYSIYALGMAIILTSFSKAYFDGDVMEVRI